MAGFWAGFGEQLSTDINRRKQTLDRLIQENLDNARIAKSNYAKRKGTADIVLKSAQAIRGKYGLSDAQTLALVEGYGTDLPNLQLTLDKRAADLKSTSSADISPDMVMSYVNAADNLTLPEGMTLQQGVDKLMGLHAQEMAKEDNPKSEGANTRSFIRAAFAFDPQLQAAEQMDKIKGPGGLSYSQLLEMQEAGFAPVQPYGDVTRAGGFAYDYTATTAKNTRDEYSRMLSTKVFNTDLTNPYDFSNYNPTSGRNKDKDKLQLKASVIGAGQALARLEKDMVLANPGQDLSLNAFRKGVLDAIYERVDSAEELESLQQSIASGTAIEIIQRKGGQLTDKDIDAIIMGGTVEDKITTPADTPADTPPDNSSDPLSSSQPRPFGGDEPTTPAKTNDVPRIVEDLKRKTVEEAEKKKEDLAASTPTVDFFMENDQTILAALEEKGITEESSREEVKQALTDFYRENQDNAIGRYVVNATTMDLERIVDVVKLTLDGLEEK